MAKAGKECDLGTCLMCRLVLKEWKHTLAHHRKNILVKKGETFIREGEEVQGIYFVYSGKVKVHKVWGNKELIIRFASKGAIVGHRGLNLQHTEYPISATALEPSLVCFIDLEFFYATLKVNPELTLQLMLFYAEELKVSEERMRDLALLSVKERLARAILSLHEQFGSRDTGFIDIELSRQDLASYSGTTYETVFRTITEMVNEGSIEIQGKLIGIKNPEAIRKICS